MKKMLFIVEKPFMIKAVKPAVDKKWFDCEITLLAAPPYYQTPLMPHSVTENAFHIGEPVYGLGKGMLKNPTTDALQTIDLDGFDLKEFDEIVYALDPDHSGVMAFKNLIDRQFDTSIYNTLRAVKLFAWDEESIERALSTMGLYKEVFADQILYGEVKRYFDWHWFVNSSKTLTPLLQEAVISDRQDIVLSKYSLQLLYFIHNNPRQSQINLINAMNNWPAISSDKAILGSPASQVTIMENLINLKLVDVELHGNKRLLSVSADGEKLIQTLSEHMDDKFMPSRIDVWGSRGLNKAKPEIDAYLAKMFNDQIRINREIGLNNKKMTP